MTSLRRLILIYRLCRTALVDDKSFFTEPHHNWVQFAQFTCIVLLAVLLVGLLDEPVVVRPVSHATMQNGRLLEEETLPVHLVRQHAQSLVTVESLTPFLVHLVNASQLSESLGFISETSF